MLIKILILQVFIFQPAELMRFATCTEEPLLCLVCEVSTFVMQLYIILEGNASLFTLFLELNSFQNLSHPSHSETLSKISAPSTI